MQNHSSKRKTELKYRAYLFSINILKLVDTFPSKKVFYIIGDQLLRSATSIGANIIEARAASSKKDFIKYFEISLKSTNETKYWLCLLRDSQNIDISDLLDETVELGKMLGASLLTMKNKNRL